MTPVFEPRRFRTAAEYYTQGRLDYPPRLIERVVELSGLTEKDAVLDLGCGPGFLVAAFAPYAVRAVGIDPEPAMLAAAEKYVRKHGVQVTLQQGSSFDLSPELGIFHLITLGRSFHWMDREATLDFFTKITTKNAVVALFADAHLSVPENKWWEKFEDIIETFSLRDPVHHDRKKNPNWLSHEAVLLKSPFHRLERISVIETIQTPLENIIARALSLSPTSPEKLGDDQPALIEKLTTALTPESSHGMLTEVVSLEALLAFRAE